MKTALLIPIFFIAACHHTKSAEVFEVSRVSIVDRIDPPFDSGTLRTWSEFTAKKDGEKIIFYITCLGKLVPLPKVGQVCDIEGEWGKIHDMVGIETQEIERARIVTIHRCR